MSSFCKSCGAPSSSGGTLLSFVCDYCGTKNVDPEYLKDYASKIDLAKASHNLQLGIAAVNGGDYVTADKHLQASVLEDANNPEPWIYLALCKVAMIKPSNYEKMYELAVQYLNKAVVLRPDSELCLNGSILVKEKLLETSIIGAQYYFDTAYKKHLAYSGSSNAIASAGQEASKGLRLLNNAFKLSSTNCEIATKSLVYAMASCIKFNHDVGSYGDVESEFKYFSKELYEIYSRRKDVVVSELDSYAAERAQIQKVLDKLDKQKASVQAQVSKASSVDGNSVPPSGLNKNLAIVVGGVVVIAIGYMVFIGGKNSVATTSAGSPTPSVATPTPIVVSPAPNVATPPAAVATDTPNKVQPSEEVNSGPAVAPAVDPALARINGRWFSDEWKYGYVLRGGVGTATVSNSPNFKPGDQIIFLKSAGETRFVGEQIYKDGKFYTISVSLLPDGRLAFEGDRNVAWIMRRDD